MKIAWTLEYNSKLQAGFDLKTFEYYISVYKLIFTKFYYYYYYYFCGFYIVC